MICGTPEDDFNRWSPLHVSAFPQEWPVIALAIANPSRIPPRSFDVFFSKNWQPLDHWWQPGSKWMSMIFETMRWNHWLGVQHQKWSKIDQGHCSTRLDFHGFQHLFVVGQCLLTSSRHGLCLFLLQAQPRCDGLGIQLRHVRRIFGNSRGFCYIGYIAIKRWFLIRSRFEP